MSYSTNGRVISLRFFFLRLDLNIMDHIKHLESQIEELTEAVDRSRKLVLIGQSGAVSGVLLLTWWTVHTAIQNFTWFLTGVSLSLGGLVLAGASRSTADEQDMALRKAEDQRDEAIDALPMRDVGGHKLK